MPRIEVIEEPLVEPTQRIIKSQRQELIQVLEEPVKIEPVVKQVRLETKATIEDLELQKFFPGFKQPVSPFGVPEGRIKDLGLGKIGDLGVIEGRLKQTQLSKLSTQDLVKTLTKQTQKDLQGFATPQRVRKEQPQPQAILEGLEELEGLSQPQALGQPQAFTQPQAISLALGLAQPQPQLELQKELQKDLFAEKTIPKEKTKEILGFIDIDLKGKPKIISPTQQSFDAFAKEPKQKKFTKINETPLSKSRAEDLLIFSIDNSVGRSGFIQPNKNPPKDLDLDIPFGYAQGNIDKFRDFKIRRGKKIFIDGVIEKTDFLIDTPGEVKQLKIFRALAKVEQQKQSKSKNKLINDIMNL